MVGLTSSADLPVLNAPKKSYGGQTDGFVAVFSQGLADLRFGTYSGGSGRDILEGLDVGSDGTVAVSGLTFSNDYPMPGQLIQRRQSEIRVGGQVGNAVTLVFRVPSQ